MKIFNAQILLTANFKYAINMLYLIKMVKVKVERLFKVKPHGVCEVLWLFDADEDKVNLACERLKDCPRVFHLSKLKTGGFSLALGMVAEDEGTMQSELYILTTILKPRDQRICVVDKLISPQFKFKVPEGKKEITWCGLRCDECKAYNHCLGCPGTIWYKKKAQGKDEKTGRWKFK